MQKKKIFIIDTNVILHDSSCLYHFQEHDIIIPITVLEELDNFKKGHQIINYHAREFVRSLDLLSSDKLFNGGMKIGPENGRVIIRLEQEMHDDLLSSFLNKDKNDHRILNIAYHVSKENRDEVVILVSKDVNLRMKAKSVGLKAEDYTTDHVSERGRLYSGCRQEMDVPYEIIEKLYSTEGEIKKDDFFYEKPFLANEFVIMKNGQKSALAIYKDGIDVVQLILKKNVCGISPRNAEQSFAVHALQDHSLSLVTITGKAGTGKTLLALAAALESRKKYHQILLTRPIVPLSNKDIGFLPGDIQSKIGPYMQPLFDNLGVIRGQFSDKSDMSARLQRMVDDGKLVIEPLAYIRGRSLVKKYMIV
ncbi:MAG: PhoH family protein, partial [Desulfobulbaceae bacterium]|nr:PhoH family protein [Desulfobulbaceae bacterium]